MAEALCVKTNAKIIRIVMMQDTATTEIRSHRVNHILAKKQLLNLVLVSKIEISGIAPDISSLQFINEEFRLFLYINLSQFGFWTCSK